MKQIRRLLPGYAVLPLGAVFVWNLLVYRGTMLINSGRVHHSMATPLDGTIPLVTAWIVIYMLAHVQWAVGYVVAGRDSRSLCCRIAAADMVAKLICLVIYLVYPTTLQRPEITESGLFPALVRQLYRMDAPTNLFPSIHCLESWMCIRMAFLARKTPRWYRGGTVVLSLLVFASTVLVKQHVVVDILGGIVTAELGLLLADKCKLPRLLGRLPVLTDGGKIYHGSRE